MISTGAVLGVGIEGIDLAGILDTETINAINAAWAKHLVLRFCGQNLRDEDLLRFSRYFGPLDQAPVNSYGTTWAPENPEINAISNILDYEGLRIGGLDDGEAQWHADMTYVETPVHACALYAIEVPKTGGNTDFANMFAAYDVLSTEIKERQ